MEATVEFLQLLAGGDQPAVRQPKHAGRDRRAGAGRRDFAGGAERARRELRVLCERWSIACKCLVGPQATELPEAEAAVARIARSLGPAERR